MSKKLLALVVLATSPTVTDNIASGYEIGQQWLNTVTGATYQMVSDGVWNSVGGSSTPSVNYIDFNSALADPSYLEGRVFWNQQDHALSFHTDVSGTSIQIGQEQVTRIVNKTGSTILNGQVVYVSGAQGNRPTVALAQADSISADKTLGVATNDIANNAEGYITLVGLVRDINTSAFTAGDRLWLSATTAGEFTNVEPSEPNHKVCIGTALNSTTNGMICVRIGHHTTKTELGLSTTDSPTFAALTLTGDLTFSGGSLVSALLGKQPLDSDLTAIAALTTTAFGRSFLTLADETAARNYVGLGTAASPTFTNLNLTTSITFSTDTNLYRAGANSLKTDDSLTVVGSIIPDQNNGINSGTTAGVTRYSGGVTNDGAVIVLGGSTNSTATNKGFLRIGATDILTWTATGVTITGSGVGTPAANQVLIGGGVGAFSNGVRSYLGGAAFEAIGIVGYPSYLRFDQTANAGKAWRVGNTGAVNYSSFDIYNQTDGVTALSFASTGVATFGGTITTSGNVRAGSIELGNGGELRLPGYDGDTDIAVNYTGYNGGTTRFRSVKFYDGKQALIATLDGETKTATFAGPVIINGSDQYLQLKETGTPVWSVQWLNGASHAEYNTAGVHRFTGYNVPGTPGASQVLIGGGQIKTAGPITIFGGTNPYLALNDGSATSYIQVTSGLLDLHPATGQSVLISGDTAVSAPSANQVLIGGGEIKTSGAAAFGGDVSVVRASNPAVLKVDGIASGTAGGSAVYLLAGGSLLGAHGVKSAISGSSYNANIWTYFFNEYHIGYSSTAPAIKVENNDRTTFYSATAPGTPGSNQVLIGGGEVKAAGAITATGFVADNGTLNSVSHYAGAASTDEKWWRWQNGSAVGSGVLRLRALNDGLTDGINALTFSRNGISSVTATFGGFVNIGGCNSTPGSSSAAGTAGDIRFDSSYIYVCVATNTWKRAALSTW